MYVSHGLVYVGDPLNDIVCLAVAAAGETSKIRCPHTSRRFVRSQQTGRATCRMQSFGRVQYVGTVFHRR